MKVFLTSVALALAVSAGALQAEDTICTGAISGNHDNVIVPDGESCAITGARIEGNVEVKTGSALVVTGPVYIGGNVQSEGSRSVSLTGLGITVEGSVQIKKAYGAVSIERGTTVLGNVQYEENSAPFTMTGAFVHGDFQLFKNYGGARVVNNTIRQNMQCKENTPAPTGRGNRAGDKEDQCSAL